MIPEIIEKFDLQITPDDLKQSMNSATGEIGPEAFYYYFQTENIKEEVSRAYEELDHVLNGVGDIDISRISQVPITKMSNYI